MGDYRVDEVVDKFQGNCEVSCFRVVCLRTYVVMSGNYID
jgi:hypothetical protein